MRTAKKIEGRKCPKCDSIEEQTNYGFNRSGTQRCKCNKCKCIYTFNPKIREYPEDIKKKAIKVYYSGVSGRGIGKIFGMSKANIYNWIKKTGESVDKPKN